MSESTRPMTSLKTEADPAAIEKIARAVLACFPQLDRQAQQVSLTLYRLLARGEPVSRVRLAQETNCPLAQVATLLESWPGIYYGDDGRIVGYWGLALGEMPHALQCLDRTLYTWCAWDTLFLPELLNQSARVVSVDPVSGAGLELDVTPDSTRARGPHEVWMSFLIPTAEMGKTIVSSFCHYIHFFTSEGSGQEFIGKHNGTFLLNLRDAVHLAHLKNTAQYPDVLKPWEE